MVISIGTKPGAKDASEIPVKPSKDLEKYTDALTVKAGKQVLYFTYYGTGEKDFLEFWRR